MSSASKVHIARGNARNKTPKIRMTKKITHRKLSTLVTLQAKLAWLNHRAQEFKDSLNLSAQAQQNLLTLPVEALERIRSKVHSPADASDLRSLEDALAEVMSLRLLLRDIMPYAYRESSIPRESGAVGSTGTVMGIRHFAPASESRPEPEDADIIAEYLAAPLCRACKSNDARAAQVLLESKADITRAHVDSVPLKIAAEHGDLKLWKVLRNHSQSSPVSASTLAASCRNSSMDVLLDICHELLQANLPLQKCSCAADSALLVAAQQQNIDALRLLLHVQADPNETWPGKHGNALMQICADDDVPALRLLLREARDTLQVDVCDQHDGSTALKTACERGSVRCVALLLAHKAKPNFVGKEQHNALSPLHLAASAGSAECVVALIHAGASVEQVTTLGITPATMAEAKGHNHVLALLTPETPEVQESNWPNFPHI